MNEDLTEGETREGRFWDIPFIKSDHRWKADNDTDDEEVDEQNPIGDILDRENSLSDYEK